MESLRVRDAGVGTGRTPVIISDCRSIKYTTEMPASYCFLPDFLHWTTWLEDENTAAPLRCITTITLPA